MTTQIGGLDIIFGDPRQPKALPLSHPKARFGKWGTETFTLKKGTVRRRGALPLPCDILFERDIPVHLRDGVKIYVDVFRPVNKTEKVPALMAWSPYGKQPGKGNQVLDDFPFRMGVPLSKLSELQKWEGPDPAFWVDQDYAIVNPDPRGVYNSEGDIYAFGTQEGRDGADVVDWIGTREWCSGKVGLTGNSYLSISQWFIAAEKPKYLAAIAPWEGSSDFYREATWGGVLSKPAMDFTLQLFSVNVGNGTWENPVAGAIEYSTNIDYVEDKAARIPAITVPAYVVASWTNPIHSYGTFRAFTRLQGPKWLRVHDSWEWPDYYDTQNRADLLKFFDHYLRAVPNDWPSTPVLRAKIIDPKNPLPLTGSLFTSTAYPPPQIRHLTLFINPEAGLLNDRPPSTPTKSLPAVDPTTASFRAADQSLTFTYTFDRDMTLCGPLSMHLAVSLSGGDDADLFVTTSKLVQGKSVQQLKVPFASGWQSTAIRAVHATGLVPVTSVLHYAGPWGQVAVSRRKVVGATEGENPRGQKGNVVEGMPLCRLDVKTPVTEGEVVRVQVPMVPVGMKFERGEQLRVVLEGKNRQVFPPVDRAKLRVLDVPDVNRGGVRVTVHAEDQGVGRSAVILHVVEGW